MIMFDASALIAIAAIIASLSSLVCSPPFDKFAHGGIGQPSSLVRYQRQALA